MYAIVASDEKNINVIREYVMRDLADSMGENTTEDMVKIEEIMDDMNDDGCRCYLGFGIGPRSAKEELVHDVFSQGMPVEDVVHGMYPLAYFLVSLKPGRNPHVGDVQYETIRFRVSLCATFGSDAITAVQPWELSMSR